MLAALPDEAVKILKASDKTALVFTGRSAGAVAVVVAFVSAHAAAAFLLVATLVARAVVVASTSASYGPIRAPKKRRAGESESEQNSRERSKSNRHEEILSCAPLSLHRHLEMKGLLPH